jgi:phage terminase large subunit-like protein
VPRANKAIGSRLMREFEDAKRDFGSTRFERSYRFLLKMENVPDSAYYEDRDIKLSRYVSDALFILYGFHSKEIREDMKSLFDPVVQKVKQLVQQQIDDAKRESSLTINVSLAG